MLFRPLELVWNSFQKGFSIFSFSFPDDTYYSLLACIRLTEKDGWWMSIFFVGFLFGPEDMEEDDD